jgi:hypothetical protein
MLPMEKSVTFTGACANEIIPSINRSFVYKAKEGGYVRISDSEHMKITSTFFKPIKTRKMDQAQPTGEPRIYA